MQPAIDVVVVGACGKMGREVVRAVQKEEDLRLAGAVDRNEVGREIGELLGLGPLGVPIRSSLEEWLAAADLARAERPCVMVDFTRPEGVLER
ncbi:MAG: 4-hydroxy-tetrahydrodipicolinate reductase, partial [Bacillota bacterium]|nr:4-hydroxy-tetrahydrodipicolinate reductase [Bacillota bacterium]